jgi:hypothetical protein
MEYISLMAEPTPSRVQSLRALTEHIARQLARGTSPDTLIKQLGQRGWPTIAARQFVVNAGHLADALREVSSKRQYIARQCARRALRGLLLTLLGLSIIGYSLSMYDASSGFSHFALGVVLCVFGSLDFLIGMAGWWQHRHTSSSE